MNEEARAVRLKEGEEFVSPEEREAAARPDDAGDYRKLFDAFTAAQRLWSSEVAEIDSACRDKLNKNTMGNRTTAIRKWYNELPKSKMEEAEKAAAKWNALGCPSKDKMLM